MTKSIRAVLEELVFYHKNCISGRTANSKDWDEKIDFALTSIAEVVNQNKVAGRGFEQWNECCDHIVKLIKGEE